MTEIHARIATIAARIMDIRRETIHPETTFRDLGMKSMDLVDLVIGCDEEFHIELGDHVYDAATIGRLALYVEAAVSEKARFRAV